MKRKTKITLSVLTSLLIGGGIGTAIGYGVWGNKEEEKTSDKTSSEPVKESANEDEKASDDEAVKPAFRFGLGGEVKKAYSGEDKDLLTIPAQRSSYDSEYMSMSVNYDGQHGIYSPSDSKALMKVTHYRDSHSYSQMDRKSYYEDHLSALVKKISDEAKTHPGYRKIAVIGEEYYGFTKSSQDFSSKAETFRNASENLRNDNAVAGGYSVLILNISDVATVSDIKDNVLNKITGTPAGNANDETGYDYYIGIGYKLIEYKNTLIDGVTKDIYIDVDKNYSKDTIISSISAKDLFGKDVPVTVTEGLDAFTPATIGVYTLKLKATDSYGQTATATVIVHIVDYVAPTVTQSKALTFTADKGQSLNYSQLSNYISVTDNGTSHGSTVSATYTYDGATMGTDWSKTFVGSDYGTHTIKVTACDGTGNTTEKSFTLTVNDGTAPVITRRDGQEVGSSVTVGLSKTFATTLSDIIAMYQAIDNVDGDVSASLAGASDSDKNFFTNNHKVGNYTITLNAKDKDNNTATITVPIIVSADIPPVFVISDTLVYTDTATPLSTNAINNIVANCVLSSKKIASLSVDASEYIGNEDKPGTYKVTYDYIEAEATKSARRLNAKDVKSGSLDIVVKEAKKQDEDEETENWFTKFCNKIKEFFEKLGNWFKGVFTKFKFDCFITNEEWEARFPAKEEKQEEQVSSSANQ